MWELITIPALLLTVVMVVVVPVIAVYMYLVDYRNR